ncbi:hypothetical protein TNCV_2794391 [Trichonephila clavipes]|nr:hypothetical protein TNCV_2794391 [Trichonephila clavipes]
MVTGLLDGVSRVRSLMTLKTSHIDRLMHIKSVMAQSPHVGVVGKLGEWRATSDDVLLTVVQNKEVLH